MSNVQTVKLDDGREVCLSYGTPVAAFIPGMGYVRTERKYSVTTSKHSNAFTGDRVKTLSDAEFCALVVPIETKR